MKIELTDAERVLILLALENYDCNLPGEQRTWERVLKKLSEQRS